MASLPEVVVFQNCEWWMKVKVRSKIWDQYKIAHRAVFYLCESMKKVCAMSSMTINHIDPESLIHPLFHNARVWDETIGSASPGIPHAFHERFASLQPQGFVGETLCFSCCLSRAMAMQLFLFAFQTFKFSAQTLQLNYLFSFAFVQNRDEFRQSGFRPERHEPVSFKKSPCLLKMCSPAFPENYTKLF